jgi:hypothetical protein
LVSDVHKAVNGALRTHTRHVKGHYTASSAIAKASTVVSRQQSDLTHRGNGTDYMRSCVRDGKAAAEERDGAARVRKSRHRAKSINA